MEGEHYYDPGRGVVERGLNLIPNACVLPHHNTFGKNWARKLKGLLPDVTLLGIDEFTGMLTEGGEWHVLGGGKVTVYREGKIENYESDRKFKLGSMVK